MCRLNPRVDFAFKKLFGSEENKDILKPFLNAILPVADQVAELELKNPYTLKNFPTDKLSILDIRATDAAGRQFTIEMQITDQLQEGYGYSDLKKTIAIHVL